MINTRSFVISISLALFLILWGYAQDLSSYRSFRLGMNLAEVAEQANLQVSDGNEELPVLSYMQKELAERFEILFTGCESVQFHMSPIFKRT